MFIIFYRRYKYTLGEKLQGLLDDGMMQKESIFYLHFKNALSFVTDIADHKLQLQRDPKILQFVESLEYHGHRKSHKSLERYWVFGFW